MPKQTAIANVNEQYLKDRENGYTREYSNTEETARQMLEEYEQEQREEEQRRRREAQEQYMREYAQFQGERNADLANWIRGMSPNALEDAAQQRRLETAKGIYPSSTGEKKTGSGRSLKKRAEDYYTPSPQTQPKNRLTPDLEAAHQRAASSGPYTAPNAYQTAMMQRNRETQAKKDASGWKSVGYTAAGMAANYISGSGSPVANIARIEEAVFNDLPYAITKNEKFNLDREPGLRDSEALKASDEFAATAQELRGKVGNLGKKLIDTAGAAGNMMGSFALFGGAAGAAGNPVDATARLANLGGGKIGSALGQAGAKIGMEILSNPGNFGISLGSAVGSYSDALKDGAGFGKAVANGLLKGATEYYSNKLFSGTPFEDSADKGYVTKLIEYAADKIGGSKILQAINATTGGRAANWIFDKAGEGLEEVVTRVMDPMIDRITYKKDVDYATVDDLTDEFFGGVLLSLLMSGGEALVSGLENPDRITEREVEKKLKAAGIDAPTARQYSPDLAKALTALMEDSQIRSADYAEKSAGDAETAAKGAASDSEAMQRYAAVYNRGEGVSQLRQGANPQRVNQAAFLTDAEAGNYFYIWNRQGAKAADAFYQQYLAPELEQRRLQATMEYIRQGAIMNAEQQAAQAVTPPAAAPSTEGRQGPPVPQNRAEMPETQQTTERSSQKPAQNQQETAQERTTPPLPRQMTQEQQERVSTPPLPLNAQNEAQEPTLRVRAQEEQAPQQRETLRIRENEVAEPTRQAPLTIRGANATVEENRQEESYGQGQQTETAAAAGEDDFRSRAETAAEGARRSYLDRIERSSGLGRVLQDLRNYRVVRGAESRASDVSRIRNQAEAGNQRDVSAQDYGIANGSAEQSAKELDNATASRVLGRNWDRAVAELARQGVTLKAMTGQLKKEDGTQVRAFFSGDGKTIVVQADHPKLSWNQLLDHEDLHRRIKADKNYRKAVEDALLADGKLQAYLPEIIDRYARAYAAADPGLSSDDVIEELLADYRAGFDMLDPLGMNPATARATKRAAKDIRGVERERYKTNGGRPAPRDITETFTEGKNSVEPPYRRGTAALTQFEESLSPEARKTYDLFNTLNNISRSGTAEIWVGSGKARHLKWDTIADKSFFAKDWNNYVKTNKEFAAIARELVAALPDSVKKFGNFNDDGTVTPTEFEEKFKMNRSFIQRVVDALPKNVVQPVMNIDGHEYRISDKPISGAVGGEEYRQAIIAEKRRLYKEGKLPTVSTGALSHDNWGAMGFLATNTKTGASGDFTTFCPQMYFNNGCFYCYRRAALTSGSNNKLTGETVWYSGEILQLRPEDVVSLNKKGGLRIQSFGDWQDMYTPMLADMLYDAQMKGLQIKIITKEPSMIETVARLRQQALGLSLYFNLSADYTIERRGESDNRETQKAAPLNAERPFIEQEWFTGEPGEDIGWKRALSVQEANEYRKKYPWVNTRIVATTLKEYIRGLIDPTVDVVTGYHGKIKYQERVSSETGETLIEVEALGDSGMPQFTKDEMTGEWSISRDADGKLLNGKNRYQKALCDAIVERGLQEAYYQKACCITGHCQECQGQCGAYANKMSTKNARNRDPDILRWTYLQMEAHPGAGMENSQLFAENIEDTEGLTQAEDLVDIYDREHGIEPLWEKPVEQALEERERWLKKKDRETAKKAAKAEGKASTEIDAEYMAAAESGDTEKAQRMVDEAAKKAGYNVKGYHGTAAKFTKFQKSTQGKNWSGDSRLGPGFYFAHDKNTAFKWTEGTNVVDAWLKMEKPLDLRNSTPQDIVEQIKKRTEKKLRDYDSSYPLSFDSYKANVERMEGILLKNPSLFIDEFKYDSNGRMTDGIREFLSGFGYDGIISEDEIVVFEPEQIKSADPVTYDDNGNIIPLSERFNPADMDIRYSVEIDPDVAKQFSMEGIEERQVQSLLRENEELKKKLKDAKAQIKTSDRTQPREEDVRRMANDILKAYSSKAEGVNESLRELAHTVMSNDARWTDVRDQAVRLAGKILENSSVLVGEDAALNREIRNAIREEKIAYTNKGDIADYGQWRKDNFGKLKIAKDGIPVDTRWEELQDTYGKGYFPDDIKNPADQIVYLSELFDRLQDVYENPYNQNMAEATEFLANDIIDRVISGEMRQAPTTYADRAETRLARETLRGELRVQKVKERLEAERERRKEQIAELKEQFKGKEAKGRENRKAKELRTKIINHAKQMTTELLKPTDKKHVPESLRKSVAAVLSAIDLGSGYDMTAGQNGNTLRVGRGTEGAEQTKRTKAFLELKEALTKEADGLVLDPELLGTVEEPGSLTRLITELADVPIANMNTEQLQVVYDALRGIEGAVKSANRMLSSARWGAVSEAADAIRSENSAKIAPLQLAGPAGRVQDLTRLDMLTPEGYFHRLGKSGQAVFKLLRSAQDKFITNMTQATEATRKIVGDTDVGALEKETHTLTMGGQEVTMTTAQIMELYCLMQRDQGLQHITTGGVLIEPVRKGIKQETQVEPLHPSMEELLNAVRLLTPDEVKMADALQKYLSEDLAELGNEATLNVYGYKKFGQEAKYWKIRSNKNEIQQSIEKETQTTSVANRGFTKAINPQANTSIKIGSIFDTYSQSVNDMATYAAWLDVGEDVNRIRNYVFRDSEGQRTGTVKGVLDRVIGTGGANYLQRLLADIANGAGMDDAGLTSGFVGAYKAAAIGANIRVIAQQPTAILRAAEMIDPKYLAVGLKNPMKAFERAKEYSPIAQWKDWGYFDINTGRKMKDVLFESSSKLEKVRQASMAMAGKADSFAWGQLWGAVEAETKDKTDLKPGTKEFYQACAERFNDIIDHTQVVDGILQRSQIMRSKNAITRMAVSFMSEPTKQYNQFMSAVYDYRHSGDKKQAKQMLARTTFSMLAAGILNVMAQALVDGLRDDDREKKYWEKVLQAFLGYNPDDNTFGEKFKTFAFSNMGEFINPASYLPYAKDIMSIIQGYSVDRMDMDAISDTITAMTRLYKAMNGEGKQSAGYSLVKAMEQGAKLLGLSVYNIDRDLTALFTTIANDADMPVLQYYLNRYRYKPTENLSKDLKGILWDARQKNDGSYDVIVNRLLKDGYTQEGIDKAMMNRLSDESGFTEARKAADEEGNNNGSYDLGETLAALDSIEVSEEDRDILLEAKLSEKQYSNYTTLLQYSDYDTWLSVMREMPANLSQAKIEAVLDKRGDLTTKQKAAYWQVLSGSTSAKNNPYSQEVGAEILNSKAENQPDKEPEKVAQMRSTLSGLGLQDSKVDALAPVLGGDGTNTSKWRAVANQNLGTDQQDAVLKSIMTDSMYRNWSIASGENISLDSYVKGREAYVDLDNSGTDQNSEWTAALEKVTFDKDTTRNNYIRGVLWQIYTGSTSTKNNPFDKAGGQKVLDAKGKGGGKGTGSNAIASLRVQKQPWEVADDMELRSMNDYGGNVDLTNRKSIPITQANIGTVRGWNNMDDARIGDRMTVASQTYNDGDTAIVVTPILPDGTLMTQRELDRYMDSIIRSGDYANADKRGIILGVFDDGDWNENLAASDEFANRLHELHERKTERRSGLRLPDAPKAEKPSSGLRIRAMTPAAQAPRSGLRIKAQ